MRPLGQGAFRSIASSRGSLARGVVRGRIACQCGAECFAGAPCPFCGTVYEAHEESLRPPPASLAPRRLDDPTENSWCMRRMRERVARLRAEERRAERAGAL